MADKTNPPDPRDIAQAAKRFLESPLGKAYMLSMQTRYNDYHQQAEKEALTHQERSDLIVKASGVKFGMSWFIERVNALDTGAYDQNK